MFRSDRFQLSVADRIFLYPVHCSHIRHHCTVAQIAGFQFFLHPHIKQHTYCGVLRLCHELLRFVVLHCLAEQCFRFGFAFCACKLTLYHLSAFIFYIEAVVPFLALFSYRSFCH